MEKYIFRKAKKTEISEIFELIMSRVAWMDEVNIEQWNKTKYDECYPEDYYETRRRKDELFVLENTVNKKLAAVGALLHEDARWEDSESAYYLHHLASDLSEKGAGSLFLEKAEEYTASRGKLYLRLDSAVGNKTLEDYYESRGYRTVGTCVDGLYEGILRQKKL